MTLPAYEKLGMFYLGRRYDPDAKAVTSEPVLYDARDLTTHAVCVGMTGSGKTGLCLSLLEEAALDGIPSIAIDPKGDIGNLELTFPELRASDFAPWVPAAEAARNGRTIEEEAERIAEQWREGLAEWDQDGARIARLRESVEMAIYTPGSTAGRPLSVLRSLTAPGAALRDDAEALRERVSASVSGILALAGVEADPVQSREHILLSRVLDEAWRGGESLELGELIRRVQKPGYERVGVIDLETFFPEKDRVALAITLNNLIASPGFAAWMEGESLDVGRLLWTESGKPRVAIVSISHLSDAERMFFVTLLLSEVVAWMRTQQGTTSLRALLYMDEVFGFFPPVANPPSKLAMLTLLKQARAFGLGVVLATQNPVDLDYKGLSNAGTWFVGRLQTERDKLRLLDGLESVGTGMDRQALDRRMSGLDRRVFLLHNVHEDGPVLMHTRWAMSYLRGPLTREEIKRLESGVGDTPVGPTGTGERTAAAAKSAARPVAPAGLEEGFIASPSTAGARSGEYRPSLLASIRLHHVDGRRKLDVWRDLSLLAPVAGDDGANLWDQAELFDAKSVRLDSEPQPGFAFTSLPAWNDKELKALHKALVEHAYRARPLRLFKCAALDAKSEAEESEGEFRARLTLISREKRDAEVEALRAGLAVKLAGLEKKRRTAEDRLSREQSQYEQQRFQTAVSFGATMLGALLGRKLASTRNVGRATTTARGAGRMKRERGDIERAEDSIESIDAAQREMEAELEKEIADLQAAYDPAGLEIEAFEVAPRKSDISASPLTLVWVPWLIDATGLARPAS
ncbi:MAG: ATP-binding protein [Longimicrobiales bacterium]